MLAPLLTALAPKIFGAVLGLASANKARGQAQEDAFNKFSDLRDAAIHGGFNPLTALEATGGAGFGAFPSSAPPLASVELLTGALQDGADELTGVAETRRATDRLNRDLAALRLDQARSGVVVDRGVPARGPLGGRPATVGTISGIGPGTSGGAFPWSIRDIATGNRPVRIEPVSNTGGFIEVETPWTGGPVSIPGDGGEPWEASEVATVVLAGVPQVAWNWLGPNGPPGKWMSEHIGAPIDRWLQRPAAPPGRELDRPWLKFLPQQKP